MSYGHAERTLALIRQLEAEARQLSGNQILPGARTASRTRRSGRQHNHSAISGRLPVQSQQPFSNQ